MLDPEMLIFCHLEAPIKSECQVARRIEQKFLFFEQKIPKKQKVPQIFWNLG